MRSAAMLAWALFSHLTMAVETEIKFCVEDVTQS
jgi:hypothetical protein